MATADKVFVSVASVRCGGCHHGNSTRKRKQQSLWNFHDRSTMVFRLYR